MDKKEFTVDMEEMKPEDLEKNGKTIRIVI